MGTQEKTSQAIAARTARLQSAIRTAAAELKTVDQGSPEYWPRAERLLELGTDLDGHVGEIPALKATARAADATRVGHWSAGVLAAVAAVLVSTVFLGHTSAWWCVVLVPLLVAAAVVAVFVGDQGASASATGGAWAFGVAGLGAALVVLHVLSWWFSPVVLMVAVIGAVAFLSEGASASEKGAR